MAKLTDNKNVIFDEYKILKKELKELKEMKDKQPEVAKVDNEQDANLIKQLKKYNKELEDKINQLLIKKSNDGLDLVNDGDELIDIPDNKKIKVMSRFNGTLNLFTYNNNVVYKFNKMFQIQNIPYKDVNEIIIQNPNRFEKGIFVILNQDIIKNKEMEEVYQKLLTKQQILDILDKPDTNIEALLVDTPKHVVDIIVSLFSEKLLKKEYVDRNKLAIISKIVGYNLEEKVNTVLNTQKLD